MLRTNVSEALVAISWMLVGAFAVFQAATYPEPNVRDPLGPGVLPASMGLGLMVLGLSLALRPPHAPSSKEAPNEAIEAPSAKEAIGPSSDIGGRVRVILIVIAYVLLLPIIHYVPATALATAAMLWAQGARGRLLLLVPGLVALSLYALFSVVLSVRFP